MLVQKRSFMKANQQFAFKRIHTLGPEATDSYAAASFYVREFSEKVEQICLHQSFEDILAHLASFKGDALLIPAAFQSRSLHMCFGDVHYDYLDQLMLIDSFVYDLDPLVLVKSLYPKKEVAYTHAATARLMARNLPSIQIVTTASKYAAYQRYLEDRAAYALTNEKNLQTGRDDQILKKWTSSMAWCLYWIKRSE